MAALQALQQGPHTPKHTQEAQPRGDCTGLEVWHQSGKSPMTQREVRPVVREGRQLHGWPLSPGPLPTRASWGEGENRGQCQDAPVILMSQRTTAMSL